jgi:hypothetical protein
LKDLPPKDRLDALKAEMGTVTLKEGLSPEQYLKSRIHLYYFLGFALICLVIVILVALAYRQPKEGTANVDITSFYEDAGPVERQERTPKFEVNSSSQMVPVAVQTPAANTYRSTRDELTYTYERVGDNIGIKPQMEYLSVLARGGPIYPAGLWWAFPKLSVKIVNNTRRTLLLSEAVIDVRASSVNKEPIVLISAPELDSEGDFYISNQGWGAMIDPVVKFAVTPVNLCGSFRAEDLTNVIHIPTLSGEAHLKILEYVPASLSNARQVCMSGEISYGTENQEKRTVKFEAPVTIQFHPLGLPSIARYTYKYDLFLDIARQGGYTRRIPIRHEIKSGDSDVFLIEIGAAKSADFELGFSFRAVGGQTLPGGSVLLHIFVPRSEASSIAKKGDRLSDDEP